MNPDNHDAEHDEFMAKMDAALEQVRTALQSAPCDTMLRLGIVRVSVEALMLGRLVREAEDETTQEDADKAARVAEVEYELARRFGRNTP